MVVEIDILRFTRCGIPPKNQPPLLVDSDTVVLRQRSIQPFKMISRRNTQIGIGCCIVNQLQFAEKSGIDISRNTLVMPIPVKVGLQPILLETADHEPVYRYKGHNAIN